MTTPTETRTSDWLGGPTFATDLTRFGGAVVLATALGVVQVFALPRMLDVPTYGAYRIFVVYGIYAGLLHLGLADGAYVRWAGRRAAEVRAEWRRSAAWLLAIQLGIVLLAAGWRLAAPDSDAALLGLGIAGYAAAANMLTLAGYALQATGDFRRGGALTVLPPAAILLGVVATPPAWRTLPTVLAIAVLAQALPALAAAGSLLARGREDPPVERAPLSIRGLVGLGMPVLAANLVAGLAQSADRLMLSAAVPVESFALYGFAASALVVANAATQGLARVAVPHASRMTAGERPGFYGRLYALIAAGFGIGLALYPAVAWLVEVWLPAYTGALPIVLAMLPGALFGVALQVVLFASLLVQKAVRMQLLVAAIAAMLVVAGSGVAIGLGAPMWGVAAAASGGLALGWALGVMMVRRRAGLERCSWGGRFVLVAMVEIGALLVALRVAESVMARTGVYVLLAAGGVWVAIRRVRVAPDGQRSGGESAGEKR